MWRFTWHVLASLELRAFRTMAQSPTKIAKQEFIAGLRPVPMPVHAARSVAAEIHKNLSIALQLVHRAQFADALKILDVLGRHCRALNETQQASDTARVLEYYLADIKGLRMQIVGHQPCNLWTRHMQMLKETAYFLKPLGNAPLPKALVWSFLRDSHELVMMSGNRCQAVSLQSTVTTFKQDIAGSAESTQNGTASLWTLLAGKCQILLTSDNISVHDTSQTSSVDVPDRMPPQPPLLVQRRNRSWRPNISLHDFLDSSGITCDEKTSGWKFRMGCVAISDKGWFACWARKDSDMLLLCNVEAGNTVVLDDVQHLVSEPDWYGSPHLVADGDFLFASNDDSLNIYKVSNDDANLTWNFYSHSFEHPCYFMHIAGMTATAGNVALLLRPNGEELYSIVEVMNAAWSTDTMLTQNQRLCAIGLFDIALTDRHVITAAHDIDGRHPVVQVWPVNGPPHCLCRLAGFFDDPCLLFVKLQGSAAQFFRAVRHLLPQAESKTEVQEPACPLESTQVAPVEMGEQVAARISPMEATLVADERWATFIESACHEQREWANDEAAPMAVLLSFSRHTPTLEEALVNSELADKARRNGVEIQPEWANGAKIFTDTLEAGRLVDLRPWHAVLDECDEELLNAALQSLPYRIRKLKPSGKQVLPGSSALSLLSVSDGADGVCAFHDDVDNDFENVPAPNCDDTADIEIQVRHTFIHFSCSSSLDQRTVHTA